MVRPDGVDTDIDRVENYFEQNCDTGLYGIERIKREGSDKGLGGKISDLLSKDNRPGEPPIWIHLRDDLDLDTLVESVEGTSFMEGNDNYIAYPVGEGEFGDKTYTELSGDERERIDIIVLQGGPNGRTYHDRAEKINIGSMVESEEPELDQLSKYFDLRYADR